ncbi:peptidoglycan/xylan/chitin deacetylase (PgdA/CDA1 family) [Streptomyces sp. BK208]|uniref:polysaccharide deacetylase family protein n=1 Tax=Streptomyces sp. BK208 TaxID=2512150 RepID=UPI00105B3514|nr:polysaccharide deacetylase family protein [Streptomyces sp. BK208]TDT42631.1 peptidoglycan/xylan/chitin deacetylase (PgdA/CDA1 family) [Streptomyces sp. BK208]
MKKDQLVTRRTLLTGIAALGAAGAGGALVLGPGDGAVSPPAPLPAPGPPQRSPLKPSAYRLQPLTGYGAPRATPRRPPVRSEPILRMTGRGRTLLLTFDDGPHPEYTPEILDTLAKYKVHATFFVCGEMADYNRDLLTRMADEGHTVGNHTWSHPLLTKLSRRRIRSEMERTSEVVEQAYGEAPRWFRAPYGAWNRAAFQLGAELGMEPLAWSVDTLDWTTPGTGTIVDRVEEGAAPGVVVLSHDAGGNRSQSVRALRRYLPELLDSGYHLTVPRRRLI